MQEPSTDIYGCKISIRKFPVGNSNYYLIFNKLKASTIKYYPITVIYNYLEKSEIEMSQLKAERLNNNNESYQIIIYKCCAYAQTHSTYLNRNYITYVDVGMECFIFKKKRKTQVPNNKSQV